MTSRILARLWSLSVMMPDLAPGERGRLHAQFGQRHHQQGHRDPLAGAHEHVVLTGWLHAADGVGQPDEVVGRLAHGAHHGHHLDALAPRAGDVVGHGADAVGVADRGTPEFLDDHRHPPDINGRRGPPRDSGPGPRPDRTGPPGEDRVSGRAQRQASPPARGERERLAAEAKAKKRRKQIRNTVIVAVIAGVVILIVFLTSSNSPKKSTSSSSTTTTVAGHSNDATLQAAANKVAVAAGCPATHQRPREHPAVSAAPPMTIDTGGDVHGDHQDHHRDVHHRARRQGGTGDGRTASCSWPTRTTSTATSSTGSSPGSSTRPATRPGPAPAGPVTSSPTRHPQGLRHGGRGDGQLRWHRHRRQPVLRRGARWRVGARLRPLQCGYSLFGQVTSGQNVVNTINNQGSSSGTPKVVQRMLSVTIHTS